ncbi:hypothetical protein MPNT_130013 [Candidatus Methylacidithermus pantelleriae]|uniref:Uncharacterized protein n=1 Tax=Candidatus Methylacidithermus pantelleriae TaxID=2744239 RepID=A0A8J2BJK2_9BACT|nr:hypothetical protein MPNT_130013 [Candidatus Methylacidithermus pantelleriae]
MSTPRKRTKGGLVANRKKRLSFFPEEKKKELLHYTPRSELAFLWEYPKKFFFLSSHRIPLYFFSTKREPRQKLTPRTRHGNHGI